MVQNGRYFVLVGVCVDDQGGVCNDEFVAGGVRLSLDVTCGIPFWRALLKRTRREWAESIAGKNARPEGTT